MDSGHQNGVLVSLETRDRKASPMKISKSGFCNDGALGKDVRILGHQRTLLCKSSGGRKQQEQNQATDLINHGVKRGENFEIGRILHLKSEISNGTALHSTGR